MESMMKSTLRVPTLVPALVLAATALLAAPVSAQSLSVLLPVISFPDPVIHPATKGCEPVDAGVCSVQE
jgi:hypothetical protein